MAMDSGVVAAIVVGAVLLLTLIGFVAFVFLKVKPTPEVEIQAASPAKPLEDARPDAKSKGASEHV